MIDDIWTIDYAVQIYDFRVEDIANLSKDEVRNILKQNLENSIKSKINELEVLIANSKDFIKNNIDDIVKIAKDYHTHHDTYYLVIGIRDSNLYYQFDNYFLFYHSKYHSKFQLNSPLFGHRVCHEHHNILCGLFLI